MVGFINAVVLGAFWHVAGTALIVFVGIGLGKAFRKFTAWRKS